MRDEVEQSVLKLEAMAAVSPALAPVVSTALSVVRSAEADVRAAEQRAALAEGLVAKVRPELDAIAKRCEDAERRLAERDEIDAAEDARERRDAEAVAKAAAERAAWAPTPAQVGQIGKMAEQVERLRAATITQAEAVVAKVAQLLTVIHKAVKNEDGLSPIQSFREHGEWTVRDADDGVIAVCEKRSDAVQLVADLLAEELAEAAKSADQDEAYRPDDTMHRPAPWRGKKKPEQPPAPGPIASGESKRKQARIL